MLRITDTHIHLWDLSRFDLPWLAGVPALNHDVSWSDYQACSHQAEWKVDKAMYVEVDVAPSQRDDESRYLYKICEDQTTAVCAGIISLDLLQPNTVERWLESGQKHRWVRGVRHVLHVDSQPPGSCLHPVFIENVNALGQAGLCFEACLRNEELCDLVTLAERTTESVLVLNHMGNVDASRLEQQPSYRQRWQQNIRLLSQFDSLYCKVSGINVPDQADMRLVRPAVEYALNSFREDRVVFATNFPVCNLGTGLAPWVETVRTLTAGQGSGYQSKLFRENANRLYRLA
ncbi:amidohydrolase family protein [Biostraticola tofi]|uniref:Putative TIM-barrel fold metal-dependent hydrolase n=1 Tax=Biostraticola tofi TaxID=466109 RepID=A0A4R3YT50_9GAMM|nr:amidohydrolase family protein [Biostraticola tofi]TCV94283.1 putative TIM-barrel fold metal-dependent hydrolase [Biostraticola tofi]